MEQGNMAINFLGTWCKRKIKLGTREQKHILGNKERQNRGNTFREHGNTRKILLRTREHEPPWEALSYESLIIIIIITVYCSISL